MIELPIYTIKEIFDIMVVVDPENYVLVINASGKKMDSVEFKRVAETSSLLESSCKSKSKVIDVIKWDVIVA